MSRPDDSQMDWTVQPVNRLAAPLAVRLRPRSLDEYAGQSHLLGDRSPLRQLLESGDRPVSLVLWGPPGTGKTTLAMLAAKNASATFVQLSAVDAGVREVRDVITMASQRLAREGRRTVLFIDEVHRFSKTQQDALLPSVESGTVTLIAATTENPHFSVISPLLSRSLVLALQPLSPDELGSLIERALEHPDGLARRYTIATDAYSHLVRIGQGDARRVLTVLESASSGCGSSGEIQLVHVENAAQRAAVRYDRDGDQHYDVISAFIKSIRGSDVDAALHYLARMVESGEDPRYIARRLIVHASEDIGLADPSALTAAVNALHAVTLLGLPEGRIPLAQATIHLALAPKSNAVIAAIDDAIQDIRRGRAGHVPAHLRDAHYPGAADLGHGTGYVYPHDVPGSVAEQQYAPDELKDRYYYHPTQNGFEARVTEALAKLRRLLGRHD